MQVIRQTWPAVGSEWDRAVNGSRVTTTLLTLSAINGILMWVFPHYPRWPVIVAALLTILFVCVSLPYASMLALYKEREKLGIGKAERQHFARVEQENRILKDENCRIKEESLTIKEENRVLREAKSGNK